MTRALWLLLLPVVLQAQNPKINLFPATVTQDLNGGTIQKNDTIQVTVKLDANGSTTRAVYFDFQHQFTAIQLLSATVATPGAQGSAIPAGATTNVNNYFYPNCRLNRTAQNTTAEGWTNYYNASYTCNSATVPNDAINRIYVNVASNSALTTGDYLYLRFKVTNVDAGFPYDSVRMNFAAAYTVNGAQQNTDLVSPRATWVQLEPGANNLVTGTLALSANLTEAQRPVIHVVTDSSAPQFVASTVPDAAGNFGFSSELQANKNYRLMVLFDATKVAGLSQTATTVSDFTLAQQEFLSQNLDGTYKNTGLDKAIRYKVADVNNNNGFDGGDPQVLFNAIAGLDTIVKPPAGCGQGCFMSAITLPAGVYDTLSVAAWKTASYALPFTTTTQNQVLAVKYALRGDPNLSHSSPLPAAGGGAALVLPERNIQLNLSNVVVTSNTITVPFQIDTKDLSVSALQFEIQYDPTKVKFDRLNIDTPSWVSFVHDNNGTLRFGAVDKDLKGTLTGVVTPFRLQFTALQPGLDLNSQLMLTAAHDAADQQGRQIGIHVSTTVVRLIGANNFR